MTTARLYIDPLWRCLCPSWTPLTAQNAVRLHLPSKRPVVQCLRPIQAARAKSDALARQEARRTRDDGKVDAVINPLYEPPARRDLEVPRKPRTRTVRVTRQYKDETSESLYGQLRILAIDGKEKQCREIAEVLVGERGEKPNLQIYNALILSNISHTEGTAWRLAQILDDIKEDKLQPDVQTCHAALKVLSVHPDHLLRNDILEYMNLRWLQLSDDGAHDIVAGLLKEGQFEQALGRLDTMKRDGTRIHAWLLDMTVYTLCEANEITEAHRIMRQRVDAGELNLSRSLWYFFLDRASEARHHPGTALVWSTQVKQKYINPSSGVCLNVLSTASQAADAVMATEVFTHLSKRSTAFQPIHYTLLMSAYLSSDPPDLERAITVLTIMAVEKLEPTVEDTRPLYLFLRDKPALVREALNALRELHSRERKIPIAVLNLLIECYVEQGNLSEALKIYKQIHTFVPISEGAQKTFANIETFNLLLKGCRVVDPPDAERASFLVSELLALKIKPTPMTYDRLILVFTQAGMQEISQSKGAAEVKSQASARSRGIELIDWAFRHFADMQALKWMPRFGTIERLSLELARLGDSRCWDVLQAGEDHESRALTWDKKGHWARRNVEEAWEMARSQNSEASPASADEGIRVFSNGEQGSELRDGAFSVG